MAQRKQYTAQELSVLSRPKLNVICTNRGIEVAEETPDADICRMILAQQAQEASPEAEEKSPETAPEPAPVSYPGEGRPENPEASAAPVKDRKNERVWFKIAMGSQKSERNDVFASLNGESVLIKRNHWVKLPRKFLAVFENAIHTQMERQENDEIIERQVPRFNVQIRTIEQGIPPEKSRPE